jgi:hypothetical protein
MEVSWGRTAGRGNGGTVTRCHHQARMPVPLETVDFLTITSPQVVFDKRSLLLFSPFIFIFFRDDEGENTRPRVFHAAPSRHGRRTPRLSMPNISNARFQRGR